MEVVHKKILPEIGTILFLDGYEKTKGSKGNHHIVYEIQDTKYGIKYLTVERDTLELKVKDYVKPFSEKFGIGIYFEPGFKYEGSQADLEDLVLRAQYEKTKKENEYVVQKEKSEITRKNKISVGKEMVHIPEKAICVIVAELFEDASDSMTDYYATKVAERVYLDYSFSTRQNMKELKKASLNFEKTKNYPELSSSGEGSCREKIIEFTSGHSCLPNYFLGSEAWNGWKVHKLKYFDVSKEENKELLYIAFMDGRYFIP